MNHKTECLFAWPNLSCLLASAWVRDAGALLGLLIRAPEQHSGLCPLERGCVLAGHCAADGAETAEPKGNLNMNFVPSR